MSTLTEVSGVNYAHDLEAPPAMVPAQQRYGRVRHLYDSYVLATGDNFGTSGLINLMKIPKGARVIGGHCYSPSLGTTGIFDIGWAASAELDSSGVALEAADADGLFVSQDAGGQAVDNDMSGAVAGWQKTFAAEVQVQADFSEASDGSGSRTISVCLLIVVD